MPAQSSFPDPELLANDVRASVISSAVFSFLEGVWYSPSGQRLAGGVSEVATNVPEIMRNAAKSGLDEAIKQDMAHARQRNDHWNSVVSWGSATAIFSAQIVGPVTAVSDGLHAAAVDGAFAAFIHLFRLDHRCRLRGWVPVTPIIVEEVSVDESGRF